MGMNRKRSQLQAYLGGLFDGEGSIGIYKQSKGKPNYTLFVSLSMCDGLAPALFWREYPEACLRMSSRSRPEWSHQVDFVLTGNRAYRFLKDIKPYTIIKHEQVVIALAYLAHYRKNQAEKAMHPGTPNYIRNSDSYINRCAKLAEYAKQANERRYKGVNTVEPRLTKHQMREYRSEPQEVEDDIRIITEKLGTLEEALQTKLSQSTDNKTMSAPEQDIVGD